MVRNTHIVKSVLDIDELKPGMKIIEYHGIDATYGKLDHNSCLFFKKNFVGSKVIIARHGRKSEIDISDLNPGDAILKLHQFPNAIQKLTEVSNKLINVLKGRGFLKFKVQYPISLPTGFKNDIANVLDLLKGQQSSKQTSIKLEDLKNGQPSINKKLPKSQKIQLLKKRRQQKLESKAYQLIEKVNCSEKIREDAIDTIEFFMDSARKGTINDNEIKSYVNKIAAEASPEAVSAITNLKKSDQTYGHCVDVASLFYSVYFQMLKRKPRKSAFRHPNEALLGGFMHDFGKAKIPKYIIDSASEFSKNSDEMTIIKSHPKFGAKMLINDMDMPMSVVNMALFHHVKQDKNMLTSYPKEYGYDRIIYETKLLSLVDAYQALVGKRNYKRSWSPPAAMRYLDALAGVEFDLEIWEEFKAVMGIYPKGSVVQLNDNSLGFVMSVPQKDLSRPTVAVFRNGYNQELDSHPLVDLQVNQHLSIQNDLDQYEVFGNGTNALEKFKSISIAAS